MKGRKSSGDGRVRTEEEGTGGVNSLGASRNGLCGNQGGQDQWQRPTWERKCWQVQRNGSGWWEWSNKELELKAFYDNCNLRCRDRHKMAMDPGGRSVGKCCWDTGQGLINPGRVMLKDPNTQWPRSHCWSCVPVHPQDVFFTYTPLKGPNRGVCNGAFKAEHWTFWTVRQNSVPFHIKPTEQN